MIVEYNFTFLITNYFKYYSENMGNSSLVAKEYQFEFRN